MIANRLAQLRVKFVQRSVEDCALMTRMLDADAPDLTPVCAIAHRLAGGGGTVGLPAVSEAATALEDACDARDLAAMRRHAHELRRIVAGLPERR